MCTLSIIKTPSGYIFTHNRDENINRIAAQTPAWHLIGNTRAWYSRDPQGGGTWMAANEQQCICLLNGGFAKHTPQANYRHSRGLVPLAFFEYSTIQNFLQSYNFSKLEPFTIIMYAHHQALTKAVWDGENLHTSAINLQHELFSSTTLYTVTMQAQRLECFHAFIANNPEPSSQNLLQFHTQTHFSDTQNNLIMSRPSGVQTLGVMQVQYQLQTFKASYTDIINQQTYDNSQS